VSGSFADFALVELKDLIKVKEPEPKTKVGAK